MAVDTRPGKAREKARQQKNLYKRRALDAEAKVARLEAELKEAREENERLTLGFEQLRQSLTVIQPEYEALKEKLEAVEEFKRRHSLGLGAKLRRELDCILKGAD